MDREELLRAERAVQGQRVQLDLTDADRARRRRKQGEEKVKPFSLASYFHEGDVGHLVVRRAELEAVLQKALSNYHRSYHQRSNFLNWEASPVLRGLAWCALFLAIATGRVKQGPPTDQVSDEVTPEQPQEDGRGRQGE